MPDITMCLDHNCKQNKTCFRYLAKPSQYQSYFVGSPKVDNYCNHYWENLSQQITQALEKEHNGN
jgi:hypothetical protein